jgi:hypothetical protein
MKPSIKISILFLVSLLNVVVISSCTNRPVFSETEPPHSNIVVKYDGYNNCDSDAPVNKTLTTQYKRPRETAWSHAEETGVGGTIPLGFFLPSLDLEAAIASYYGEKESRTWEDETAEAYQIESNSQLLTVVYYQEVVQTGTIEVSGQEIAYEYPAELTIVDRREIEVTCFPKLPFQTICMGNTNGPHASLSPAYEGIDHTWMLATPDNGDILEIDVEMKDPYLAFRVKTACTEGPCDWGLQWVCLWDLLLEIRYDNLGFKETTLTFLPIDNGELKVTAQDHYINPPLPIEDQYTDYTFR